MDKAVIIGVFWFAAWQTVSCLFADPTSTTCEDLDTAACKLFQKADLEMCQKPQFGESSCKRYCGNCPMMCYSCPEATENPANCNVTAPCDFKEICMYKHATVGGQSRYMFTCERKEICEGLTIGFGKRSKSAIGLQDDMAKERMERNVAVKCCDSDYCNSPFGTMVSTNATSRTPHIVNTTTPYPEQTTVTAATTEMSTGAAMCYKDIVFVLDGSIHVTRHNFDQMLELVTRIVSQIYVGINNAHVSLMTYNNKPEIQWYLDAYITQAEVLAAIKRVPYLGGEASINKALDTVRTNILNVNNGDRLAAGNAVVVLTNGANSASQVAGLHALASALHAVSKDVVSISIGHGVHQPAMETIATDRSHVFHIQDHTILQNLVHNVANIICS